MTLDELKLGEWAQIEALLMSPYQLKLIEMGIFGGRTIRVVKQNIGGDPTCYQINNSKIMLRIDEAKTVIVSQCSMPQFQI